MRAQWVCSRERRIALYKRSSISQSNIEPSFGTGHSLSLICQPTSEDMKLYIIIIILLWGCASGGVCVPCVCTHAGWELPWAARVFVVLVLCWAFRALINSLERCFNLKYLLLWTSVARPLVYFFIAWTQPLYARNSVFKPCFILDSSRHETAPCFNPVIF